MSFRRLPTPRSTVPTTPSNPETINILYKSSALHPTSRVKNEGIPEVPYGKFVHDNFDASTTWKDIEWVRSIFPGTIILKGILDPEDAKRAVQTNIDGILVSNHGGRQLDSVTSTIRALPKIVDAVQGKVPVFMDGGIRSGLDVLKALALGAKACFVGRAWAYALGAAGEAGVRDMLDILREELKVAMVLTGCSDVARATPDLLLKD